MNKGIYKKDIKIYKSRENMMCKNQEKINMYNKDFKQQFLLRIYFYKMFGKTPKSIKKSQSNLMLRQKSRFKEIICSFCGQKLQYNNRHHIILCQLLLKYSASQNFYYSKDIHDIMSNTTTSCTNLIKDYRIFDSREQCLRTYVKKRQYNKQISELTEYYKYYKDLPRIHMKNIDKILKKYHESKRIIQYNKLKTILNLVDNKKSQKITPKKVFRVQTENLLNSINFSSQLLQKQNVNQSLSVLQIKERLATIIKNDKYSKNFNLSKLDNQYSFQKITSKKDISKTQYFQEVSDIINQYPKSPIKLCMKKKPPNQFILNPTNSQIKKKTIKPDRKRMSMENIRTLYLKSERSVQNKKKFKRRSQDNLNKQDIKNIEKEQKNTLKKLKENIQRQLKEFLASTESSYQKLKLKLVRTPTSQIKKDRPQKISKLKHNRVVSEQFQINANNLENLKKQKFKITINQNNVFNIVLGQKQKEYMKSPKGIKKLTKKVI